MALTEDSMVNRVLETCISRSEAGMKAYGMTMTDNPDKNPVRWIDDTQEELWDAILYLEKLKSTLGET